MLFGLMRQKVLSSGFTSLAILGRKSIERSLPAATTSYSTVGGAYYNQPVVGSITFESGESSKESVFSVSGVDAAAASGLPVVGCVTFGPSVQLPKWREELESAGIKVNVEELFDDFDLNKVPKWRRRELHYEAVFAGIDVNVEQLYYELNNVPDFDKRGIGEALDYLVHDSYEADSFLAMSVEERKTFLTELL